MHSSSLSSVSFGVQQQERAIARLAADEHLRFTESPPPVYRKSPVKSARGLAQQLIDDDRGNV